MFWNIPYGKIGHPYKEQLLGLHSSQLQQLLGVLAQ